MEAFRGMIRMVAVRLALAAATIWAVATLVFFGMQLIEGSYIDVFFPLATPEQKLQLTVEYGLDGSAVQQYLGWLRAMADGNFGTSLVTKQPVLDELVRRLPLTLELGVLALLIIAVVGFPLGVLAGLWDKSALSQSGRVGATLMMSIPDFVMGSFCVWLFSAYALGLKAGGWAPISEGQGENLRYALLPAIVLSLTGLGLILATARSGVLQVRGQDHVLAAVSRGLTPGTILRRDILRNTLIPVLTLFAIIAGYLLGGAVLVETVFNLDGVGRLLAKSIGQRDYPVVQIGVILIAAVFVLLNTLADLLYAVIDPRIGGR
jgi:peptide/nickel transport system permease protein